MAGTTKRSIGKLEIENTMLVLDTNHLTGLGYASAASVDLLQRLNESGDDVVTTVISLEEQMRGWLAAINRTKDVHHQVQAYDRLRARTEFLGNWIMLPWDEEAANRFEAVPQRWYSDWHLGFEGRKKGARLIVG